MSTASEASTGTTGETVVEGAAAAAPASPVTGVVASVTDFFGLTSSKETEATLEAERKKCNDDIDARLQKLREAAPAQTQTGGGRKRTKRSTKRSTRRSRRSKRSKKSKRTRC